MVKNGFEVVTASSSGAEVEELKRQEGVSHIPIDFTRTISPIRDLISLFQCIFLILRIKPQIVHTHTPKAGLIGMIAAKICQVPVRMHTVAGMPLMETSGVQKKLLTFTEQLTYRCATNVYPNSFRLKDWILQHLRVQKEKVYVIANGSSNGIDSKYFETNEKIQLEAQRIRAQLKIPVESKVFLFVGRIVRDKGIQELVLAFYELKKKSKSPVDLILVGGYENEREPVPDKIKDMISRTKNIHEVGFKLDVRPYLQAADIFVFPSYREGFPNVIMQAACFNLPIIASDINGCNELIEHEKNGVLIPPKDVQALSQAMYTLFISDSLRGAIGKQARAIVVKKYDQQLVWDTILKEYRRLLKLT